LAEHHGTFHDTPSNKLHQLNLQNKLDIKERGQKKMESSIYVCT
jgi:hypothetical protein